MIVFMKQITTALAIVAAFAATGCTSYEMDMPLNPTPAVGPEVTANIVYQVNPRFFGNNECLNGIKSDISRIADMGCDVLWIMPVCEPGELNAIGSPYCIRDFKAVNPQYGSIEDLKNVVTTAHSSGMRVILDWVANHTAWDCSWVTEHADWYVQDENGNVAATESWPDVAQLNYSNPDLCAAMTDAIVYWVDQVGIDGFRFDYVDGVPGEYWASLNATLRAKNPDMILLAETSKFESYADGFDLIYDWECGNSTSSAFTGGKAYDVVKRSQEVLASVPEGKSILRFAFNHDVAASNDIDRMFGSIEGVPAAYALTAMLNGTPMIYSSMDVEGLSGKQSFFDYKTLEFSNALTAQYKAINNAFKASQNLRCGELADYSTSKVACFTRSIPGHKLLVVVNTTGDVQTVKAPIELANASMTDLITGTETTVPTVIELAPYGYTILQN